MAILGVESYEWPFYEAINYSRSSFLCPSVLCDCFSLDVLPWGCYQFVQCFFFQILSGWIRNVDGCNSGFVIIYFDTRDSTILIQFLLQLRKGGFFGGSIECSILNEKPNVVVLF